MLEQLAGRGGGAHERLRMSQRAVPELIMQPMLPLGDLNVARCSVGAADALLEALELVLELVADPVGIGTGELPEPVAPPDVVLLVTVTVLVLLPPQPANASMTAVMTPRRRFTDGSVLAANDDGLG